jgi:murein DD-endopeptidase MepM/ murein hydrolase activator NlpD
MRRILTRLLFGILLLFPSLNVIPLHLHSEHQTRSTTLLDYPRFLITPYYGSQFINSFFDHRLPNGTHDGNLLLYTGEERTNPDPLNCQAGWNCYDGHNGFDFDLEYEQVIASADGTVEFAGWNYPDHHK